jgi:hypothetical protein
VPTGGQEYEAIYVRFADLLREGQSDIHSAPLRLVADIFLVAERLSVAPFEWA